MTNREYEDNLNKHKDKLFLECMKMCEEMKGEENTGYSINDFIFRDNIMALFRNSKIISEANLNELAENLYIINDSTDSLLRITLGHVKGIARHAAHEYFKWKV